MAGTLYRMRTGLVVAGSAMTVVGILGLAFDWGSSAAGSASSTSASSETPRAFASAFVTALRSGDRAFLFDRMDPAVISRYGAAPCQALTAGLVDPNASLAFVGATGPTVYTYASSGKSTQVPDTYTFTFTGTVAGVSGTHQYHFALVDGRFRIFVDCSPNGS